MEIEEINTNVQPLPPPTAINQAPQEEATPEPEEIPTSDNSGTMLDIYV